MSNGSQRIKRQKVQVVIFLEGSDDVELLLLMTTKQRGSYWQNVTGGVESDDNTLGDSARREVFEETGIKKIKLYSLNYKSNFIDRWDTEVTEHYFLAIAAKHEQNIKIDLSEHQEWTTTSLKKVEKSSFGFPSNYEAFLTALDKYNKNDKGDLL